VARKKQYFWHRLAHVLTTKLASKRAVRDLNNPTGRYGTAVFWTTNGLVLERRTSKMAQPNLLRPITQRLGSTPVQELPHIAHFLASSISTCSHILEGPGGGRGDESVLLVHKLKTRLTSLLQDRSTEGRFTAVVLIKATIEAGGLEMLSTSEPWIRGLINILGKSDPIAVKKLCIVSITRVFSLTQAYPSLIREITTPLLPSFITACLNIIRPKIVKDQDSSLTILSPMLHPVLHCWLELLPQNPTTFRPFVLRIQPICLSLVGDDSTPHSIARIASQLLAHLHLCAPKNGSATQWIQMCQEVISAAHKTADEVFRPVLEDWVSSDPTVHRLMDYGKDAPIDTSVLMKFPKWSGIRQGANRIKALLAILADLLSCQTALPVPLPLGPILDLTTRLTSVTVPSTKDNQYTMRHNQEVGREEREQLWAEVLNIHLASLRLLATLVKTFGSALLPVCNHIVEQVVWVFGTGSWFVELRTAVYVLLGAVLPLIGSSLTRDSVKSLSELIQKCCQDQIHLVSNGTNQDGKSKAASKKPQSNGLSMTSADSFVGSGQRKPPLDPDRLSSDVERAAHTLLPLILTFIPAEAIPQTLRTEIDRSAILTQHKNAMLASVMNPPPKEKGKSGPASIMAFMVRGFSGDTEIEALLRPRMPVIQDTLEIDAFSEGGGNGERGHGFANEETNSTELLFQLEDSFERDGGFVSSNQETTMQAMESISDQAPQSLLPLKRNITSVQQNEAQGEGQTQPTAFGGTSNAQDFVKRPRLEGQLTDLESHVNPTFPEEEVQKGFATQGSSSPVDVEIASVTLPQSAGIASLQNNVPALTLGQREDDGDSSDSEIPAIDIEPDTEEEEDLEDG
jgi:pre-rRNA-processing protein RIX1